MCIAPVYCSDLEEMQPHGISVWIVISEKSDGVSKGAVAPFGTQPLEQRCSVLYLTARLAGKMRVLPYEHTRFIRLENGQVFVNGNEQKSCSVSTSGGSIPYSIVTHCLFLIICQRWDEVRFSE